ncbi:MAG TPA: fumarylacetoacetate hydrolase family protein [Dehalococcoidales bacterium]|nr:fumarylacetoacetate hydrolase family protein [Dehalococcoidales bacterium]
MKIVRFRFDKKTGYGTVAGKNIRVLRGSPYRGLHYSGVEVPLHQVKLLSPCAPSKIVCLGLNYILHAAEGNFKLPSEPLIFLKPPTALIGPDDNIIYPDMSERVDYEGELAVVIGKKAARVSPGHAFNYVLGYTCFNDVTARDLQGRDGQWTRAKGFDTFAAVGPWIETEVNAADCQVETYLNGELKQKGTTRDMIFAVPQLISFVSQVMTLLPGDVIATGTPSGIGPMQPGDKVEVKIAPVGTLRNFVVKH